MLLLAGAVPIDKLPLLIGEIEVSEQGVKIEGHDLAINRGNEARFYVGIQVIVAAKTRWQIRIYPKT